MKAFHKNKERSPTLKEALWHMTKGLKGETKEKEETIIIKILVINNPILTKTQIW